MFQDIKLQLVKLRMRIDRGYGWIKYLRDFLILFSSFKILGIPYIFFIPIIAMLYFLGWLDETKGIWKLEAQYGAQQITEFKKELFKKKRKL